MADKTLSAHLSLRRGTAVGHPPPFPRIFVSMLCSNQVLLAAIPYGRLTFERTDSLDSLCYIFEAAESTRSYGESGTTITPLSTLARRTIDERRRHFNPPPPLDYNTSDSTALNIYYCSSVSSPMCTCMRELVHSSTCMGSARLNAILRQYASIRRGC